MFCEEKRSRARPTATRLLSRGFVQNHASSKLRFSESQNCNTQSRDNTLRTVRGNPPSQRALTQFALEAATGEIDIIAGSAIAAGVDDWRESKQDRPHPIHTFISGWGREFHSCTLSHVATCAWLSTETRKPFFRCQAFFTSF